MPGLHFSVGRKTFMSKDTSDSSVSSTFDLLLIWTSSSFVLVFLFSWNFESLTGDEDSYLVKNCVCFSGEKHTLLYVVSSVCNVMSK